MLDLQEKYPWILLEMVSPFDGQADKWPLEYRMRHERLFAAADIITATGHRNTRGCMFARNRYLVENSDLLLAAYDGQPGGTAMTVECVRHMRIPVECIRPDGRQAERSA